MAPERARHVIVKLNIARALQDAVRRAGLPCIVFTGGMSVVINSDTTYEPDASAQCGASVNLDATIIERPMIVVEVTSPSSAADDTGGKLADYFTLASVQHVLVVDPSRKIAMQHSRSAGAEIITRILREPDELSFEPPGFTTKVSAFYDGL